MDGAFVRQIPWGHFEGGILRMKQLLIVAFTVLACAVSATAADPKVYAPQGVGFRLVFPGAWVTEKQDIPTDVGKITMHMAIHADEPRAFLAISSVFPKAHIDRTPRKLLLDNARDGAIKNVKGRLRSEVKMKMDGNEARHIVVDLPGGKMRNSQRFVVAGATLYQAIYTGPNGSEDSAQVQAFFDSFVLTEQGHDSNDLTEQERGSKSSAPSP